MVNKYEELVIKLLTSIEANTEDDVHEYLMDDGGQLFEELGLDCIRLYLRKEQSNGG